MSYLSQKHSIAADELVEAIQQARSISKKLESSPFSIVSRLH